MTKFKLITETKVNLFGVTLFRIELTADCKWGKIGEKGGYIEKKENLSGNAWVSGDAWVSGNARVYGNAWVYGDAQVSGNAQVSKYVFLLNFVYKLTLTDDHIQYGCILKTIEEWINWLSSDEIINTPRSDKKFKLIEMSLNLAIEQWKQLNRQ